MSWKNFIRHAKDAAAQEAVDFRANGVKADVIAESTSATGVTIDGVLLKDTTVDVNGAADAIILDADGDTTISAPTADQIDIEVAGADDFTFTANTFTALSGSSIKTNTIDETTSTSGVTIDGLLIKDKGIDGSALATGELLIKIPDNKASGLDITEGTNSYIKCATTNSSELVTITPACTVTGALTSNGGITLADNKNVTINATTGSRFGANTSKIGFFGKDPVVSQTNVANTDNNADNMMNAINLIATAMRNLGLIGVT